MNPIPGFVDAIEYCHIYPSHDHQHRALACSFALHTFGSGRFASMMEGSDDVP